MFQFSPAFRPFQLSASGDGLPPLPPQRAVLETGTLYLSGGEVFYDPPLARPLDAGSFLLQGGDLIWQMTRDEVMDAGAFVLSGGDLAISRTAFLGAGDFRLVGQPAFYDPPLMRSLDAGMLLLSGGDLNLVGQATPDVSSMNLYMVLSTELTGYYLDPYTFTLTGGDLVLQEITYAGADISSVNMYVVYGPEP